MLVVGISHHALSRSAASTRQILGALALLMGAVAPGSGIAGTADLNQVKSTEVELRGSTQQLLDAIAPGEVAVWDRLLDPAVIQIDENDVVRRKPEILAALKPLGPGLTGHLRIDDFRMVQSGDVAIVTHEDDESLDYHGQLIRSRFRLTDTWHRTPGGWRLLGSQALAVQKDPPAVTLDEQTLCGYAGRYVLTADIDATIRCAQDRLVFERRARPAREFLPEVTDVFFEPGSPRTRRIFQRDPQGRVTGFVDRREERDIVWTRSQ